jgi:uncharacterized protein YdbL (DUF1318 family)
MDLHIRRGAAVAAACALILAAGLAACRGPTVGIVPPSEPITLNINITVQQEVRVKLEEDVATLLDREEGTVATRSAAPGDLDALGGLLARREPEIEAFKAQGLVGERYDGLLGVVQSDAAEALQGLVETVNDARRQAYADIAERHAAPLADVQALAAKTRIESAPPGEYVMLEPGVWRKIQELSGWPSAVGARRAALEREVTR